MLSTSDGGQFSHGSRITYSFVPDGTSIGGIPSNLFQTLNAKFATATWEQQFQKAAAVWQAVANINLALVPDDGTAIGASGSQQGDPRFGDIRIGAYPQSSSQLAIAFLPAPVNGGPDSSDLFINSSVSWKINNDYDLETVAIHEIGHALGLGHSSISAADMYASYTAMKQGLNSDDTAGIQSIYGAPGADATNNATSGTAIDLTPLVNGQGQGTLAGQTVTGSSDLEWYKVTVPSTTTGTMVLRMQSNSLSSLCPRMAVFNGSLQSLGQATAANGFGATATFTVTNVVPGQVYYIRASTANTGPGSNGSFGLQVNFGASAQAPIVPTDFMVPQQPDKGSGSSAMETSSSSDSLVSLNIGSLFGVSLGLNNGLSLSANVGPIDLGIKVQIGTLSVWADPLSARSGPVHHHPHPAGPLGGRHHGHATSTHGSGAAHPAGPRP